MSKKILITEDSPTVLGMMKQMLEESGYSVLAAQDGQEALDLARKEKPDLIVLDLMLPKMDGYKVCGLLKADTRYHNIPIIIFTARAQESDKQMGREAGADAYLIKPFRAEELLEKVEFFLNKGQE